MAADPRRRLAVMQAIRDEQDVEFEDTLHAILAHIPDADRDEFIAAVVDEGVVEDTAEATDE